MKAHRPQQKHTQNTPPHLYHLPLIPLLLSLLSIPNSDLKLAPAGDFSLSHEAEVMQISRSRDQPLFHPLQLSPNFPSNLYKTPENHIVVQRKKDRVERKTYRRG